MSVYPKKFLLLIECLKKLPGVGKRTAERFAFELLSWNKEDLSFFGSTICELKTSVLCCEACGCLQDKEKSCHFCSEKRNQNLLCIIASPKDAFALDQTNSYNGLYHVLGSLISPLEGKHAENLDLDKLFNRIKKLNIEEVILALDSTLEGDATSLFLNEHLQKSHIKVSKLALGLPVGSNLEYVDQGTLSQAFLGRHSF